MTIFPKLGKFILETLDTRISSNTLKKNKMVYESKSNIVVIVDEKTNKKFGQKEEF